MQPGTSAIAKLCARQDRLLQGHRHRRPEPGLHHLGAGQELRQPGAGLHGPGHGLDLHRGLQPGSCMANGKHAQPGERIRIINGRRDMFVGGHRAIARSQTELVPGLKNCTGRQSCFPATAAAGTSSGPGSGRPQCRPLLRRATWARPACSARASGVDPYYDMATTNGA